MQNILVGLDFSDNTAHLIECASVVAKGGGGHIWLVHIAAPNPAFVGYEVGPQSVRDDVAREVWTEHGLLQEQARSLREAGFEVTALLLQGPSVETLLSQAEKIKADWIVVGTHGHGALYHLWMGSVVQGVLRKATCPVLTVPASLRK